MNITGKASQLLICYEYDQKTMDGPPFSIVDDEIKAHYQHKYDITLVDDNFVSGGLKGNEEVVEKVYLLQKIE